MAAAAALEVAEAIETAETAPEIIGNVTRAVAPNAGSWSPYVLAGGSVVTTGLVGAKTYYDYKADQAADKLAEDQDKLARAQLNELQNADAKPNPVAMNISNPYALPKSYLPAPIQPAPLQSATQTGYAGSGVN
jgi:hypothetical protein